MRLYNINTFWQAVNDQSTPEYHKIELTSPCTKIDTFYMYDTEDDTIILTMGSILVERDAITRRIKSLQWEYEDKVSTRVGIWEV